MFFNHLQELSPLWTGKILLAKFTGMFFDAHRDCQGSDPVHATRHCHVPTWDSPWLHIKIRDRREGQENHLSLGVQLCLLEQGFALNFSIPVLAPLHSSISSGGSTFPRLICKHRNSSQFLFWRHQRKQQTYFWNLLAGLKGLLFSLVYLADLFNYLLSLRCLPRWAREAIQTMFTVAEEILTTYPTAHVFIWSHSHKGNRILQDALGGLSFSRDSSHYEVYNNVPEFPDLLHRTFTSLTAENQACGWWLPFHSSHTCPPYHLPEALAGPDLFNVSSCPLPFCPICFPGGALLCITLPVTADNDALCAFAQETDGKQRRGRHLRHAVVVSEGAGCDGLVEKRAVWHWGFTSRQEGTDGDPETHFLCGELQEHMMGSPADAQERKGGKNEPDEVTVPSRSRITRLVASRTSSDARDDLQTLHLLGNGLDTKTHINSYSNRAWCQGLYFPTQNINKEHPGFKHSI